MGARELPAHGADRSATRVGTAHQLPRLLLWVTALLLASSCELPLGLALPTTRGLENGSINMLAAGSLEVSGSYEESGNRWEVDVQVVRPNAMHVVASSNGVRVEAILLSSGAYYRGQDLLARQMNGDEASRSLARAAGNAWWKGLTAGNGPYPFPFADGPTLKAAFINSGLVARQDHVVDHGVDTARLSGPRADVYVAEAAPHQLVRLHLREGATLAGITKADLFFSHYGADIKLAAPPSVINFADLSTLPPNYTVLSVDASGCGSPCVVRASLKNLGGRTGGQAPSTIAFQLTDLVAGTVIGSCLSAVAPDVGYNAATMVSCTIARAASQDFGAARLTATPTNPGHA